MNSGAIVDDAAGVSLLLLLLLEHSASFSVVEERNVVGVVEVVRIETVLWCVENAAAEEHDALTRSAVERILLENFMIGYLYTCCLSNYMI